MRKGYYGKGKVEEKKVTFFILVSFLEQEKKNSSGIHY